MISDSNRLSERKQGQNILEHLVNHRSRARIIHYACESFSNPTNRIPRITSISIYDFDLKQIESFSIHLSAQEKGYSHFDLSEDEIDSLEKDLLKKFFTYARANKHCNWIHWKMKDLTYGFKVLELRFKMLKGKPMRIQNENKYDLSEILKLIYSNNYETSGDIGKSLVLARRNGCKLNRALTGLEEANAFERKEFHLLHHSSQQKVEGLAFILDAAAKDKLTVAARFYQIYGSDLRGFTKLAQEHPIYSLLSMVATLFSVYQCFQPAGKISLGLFSILGTIKESLFIASGFIQSI